MDLEVFNEYLEAIPMLRARELLELITVSAYPQTKPEFQKQKHREIYKQAYPSLWDGDKKPLTLEELSKVISNGGR